MLPSTGLTGSLNVSVADVAAEESAPNRTGGVMSPDASARRSGNGPHCSSMAGRIRQLNFLGKNLIKSSDNGSINKMKLESPIPIQRRGGHVERTNG